METAQIILMRDRLTDVVQAIQLSRATFNKIQNLFWAFAYNTLGIQLLPVFCCQFQALFSAQLLPVR